MQTIWKQNLIIGPNMIAMPINAKILSLQIQEGKITLWFLFDKEDRYDLKTRIFNVFATGEFFDQIVGKRHQHVGTVQIDIFVWHVFETVDFKEENNT